MTNTEKWQKATTELLQDASRSDRRIAETLGFSASFIGDVRRKLEAAGQLLPGKRLGKDKKERGLPRNLKVLRKRLFVLLKEKRKRRKIKELEAWIRRLDARELEEYLAAPWKGEIFFVSAAHPSQSEKQAKPILGFTGAYRWLSNFWPAPVVLDGMAFSSVEHAFQAAQTLDLEVRAEIAALTKPWQAKRRGRWVEVRPDWDDVKLSVMEDLLRQKFRIPDLKEKLLDTGDAHLEERGDRWWGAIDGKGENHLGKLLMRIREEEVAKEGLVAAMMDVYGSTEEEARKDAENVFNDFTDEEGRKPWTEIGKERLARRKAGTTYEHC